MFCDGARSRAFTGQAMACRTAAAGRRMCDPERFGTPGFTLVGGLHADEERAPRETSGATEHAFTGVRRSFRSQGAARRSISSRGVCGRRSGSLASMRWTSCEMPGDNCGTSERKLGRFGLAMLLGERRQIGADKRAPAAEQLVKRDAQTVDVAADVGPQRRSHHLRSDVVDRAANATVNRRAAFFRLPGEPEIQQRGMAVFRQENIAWLDVGVHPARPCSASSASDTCRTNHKATGTDGRSPRAKARPSFLPSATA